MSTAEPYIIPPADIDIRTLMKIDQNALQDECADQPGHFAYWAAMAAEAEKAYELAKVEMSRLESQLDLQVRNEFRKLGQRITDTAVNAAVKRKQEWLDQTTTIARLKARMSLMLGIKFGFAQRKDMLSALMYDASREYRGLVAKKSMDLQKSMHDSE